MKSLFLIGFMIIATGLFAQQTPASTPQSAKHAPRAKSKEEFKDFSTATATTGGAAMETAADNFAKKYPDSELRASLYLRAMHEYQTANQPEKLAEMANKVLALDPENPVALVLASTVASNELSETSPDMQKANEVKKNASLALQTIDTSFQPPQGATPEQVAAYKGTLKAMAHSALGIMELKTGNDADAETDLKAAIELNKTQTDPYTWYQLALSQDHQKKYPEALASVNEALRSTNLDPNLANTLQAERDRLTKLTSGGQSQPAK